MSGMPECRRCGNYIHSGPVVCLPCLEMEKSLGERLRDYAMHSPLDLKSCREIQSDLLALLPKA